MAKKVLVTSDLGKENLVRLSKVATVYASWKLDQTEIDEILPEIDVLMVLTWPGFLTEDALSRMKRLRFVQSVLVGVNLIPFRRLGGGVIVASNAGAYSLEVGEHAWALLLAAAKSVVNHDIRIRNGVKSLQEFLGEVSKIAVLEGKTLGVVGYGGIGRWVERYAKAFGMKILPYGRGRKGTRGTGLLSGRKGLDRLLRESDAVLLSVPLTKSTFKLIGGRELSTMKDDAILVNVARGDIVDERALYSHLVGHPAFRYATDVWWFRQGRETLETEQPLAALPNFIGTPHTSGSTASLTGKPSNAATDNVLLYLRGRTPRHLVDRSEYEGM